MTTRTCPNCGGQLHPCSLGEHCGLFGWRHENGAHECEPVLGGRLFTFPAELHPVDDAPPVWTPPAPGVLPS
jgi:hypothetical protein